MSLATRIATEFNSVKTELDNSLNKDLSNLDVVPAHLISQITGTGGVGQFATVISKDINGNYPDNESIYISPSNIAYYKTTEGWIEVGKLMVETGNNKSIACGGAHTVFLLQDGTCKAVGKNSIGQLGDGTTAYDANESTPVVVLNVTNCMSIACGESHTTFLLSDGTCKAVGYNNSGGLGDGTTTPRTTPVAVLNITNCISIDCGSYHTVFLLQDGTCKSVGYNSDGQLGDGTTTFTRTTPVVVLNITNCISITCGQYHTTFLLSNGTCKSVGNNSDGQLGDGTTTQRNTPVPVLSITNCISIACGLYHTTFLLQDGTCKSVGLNTYGGLGDGTLVSKSTPVVVSGITNCISITCGGASTVFLLQDGTCKAVGFNSVGQLGDGTTTQRNTPVPVLSITNCISIASGSSHTIFLLQDGTCKAVGLNYNGQLGDGTNTSKSTPVSTSISGLKTSQPLSITEL